MLTRYSRNEDTKGLSPHVLEDLAYSTLDLNIVISNKYYDFHDKRTFTLSDTLSEFSTLYNNAKSNINK